ncbi:HAD family hydrolase [Clostridium sp. 'deep sea']|uniref:HAD family hydrolase n=1 Tax=Clostridium sp. 'deep sea' TaxID=2779445 RepID=UPI00189676E6|nr:HAD family hydrolase [Clostridium sp. 'deep sea']QOR34396.1 HAD family hydrolase [Clostridium sp. 'deep sea']
MKIVFDIDGTLFNSRTVALPAFKKVLKHYNKDIPSDSILLNTLGYPISEIWEMLLPELSNDDKDKISVYMGEIEAQMINNGDGKLFPGVKESLTKLQAAGHKLYTLSNCNEAYLHTVIDAFNLRPLFTGLHCASMYANETKAQILKRIIKEDKDAVMVGDRFHDIEAGNINNIPTIFCNYGFSQSSEITSQDFTITSFSEILTIVKKLSSKKE